MAEYRILKKSPFVRHTILKNDLPDYFIAFLCDNFFLENLTFLKKNLEMDFFQKKKIQIFTNHGVKVRMD